MKISEETLMAFADGELDQAGCEAVEQALRDDPALEARVARHRALRRRLRIAYTAPLDEPVPERLLAAAREAPPTVVNLSAARASRARNADPLSGNVAPAAARLWWRPVGSLAASVLVGVALGYALFRQGGAPMTRAGDGALVAGGVLAHTLSQQLAIDQPAGAAVHVGLSFLNRSGEYCRSFTLAGAAGSAGIACHRRDAWRIEALGVQAQAETGAYRTAATALSPQLLQVVQDQIQGETLDAAAEEKALRSGWHLAP